MAVALLGFTIFGPATAQEGADLNSAPACVGPDYQAKSTDELVQLAPVVLRGTVSMVGQVRATSQCGSGVYPASTTRSVKHKGLLPRAVNGHLELLMHSTVALGLPERLFLG